MRKTILALSPFSFLAAASQVIAQAPTPIIRAGVKTPPGIVDPTTTIGSVVTFLVAFIIIIAALAALLYIVIGAFQWITSGGDKQKVADARNHIMAAIIGLIIISLSFVIINVITQALGLGPITDLKILTLPEINKL